VYYKLRKYYKQYLIFIINVAIIESNYIISYYKIMSYNIMTLLANDGISYLGINDDWVKIRIEIHLGHNQR